MLLNDIIESRAVKWDKKWYLYTTHFYCGNPVADSNKQAFIIKSALQFAMHFIRFRAILSLQYYSP